MVGAGGCSVWQNVQILFNDYIAQTMFFANHCPGRPIRSLIELSLSPLFHLDLNVERKHNPCGCPFALFSAIFAHAIIPHKNVKTPGNKEQIPHGGVCGRQSMRVRVNKR